MSHSKKNTAKLLTLAITITLLGGLPLMAQDAEVSELVAAGHRISDTDPQLMSTRPILGKEVTLDVTNVREGLTWFFFSLAPDSYTMLGNDSAIYFDLENYVSIGGYAVDPDGYLSVSATLPEIPEMAGIEISIQAANVTADAELKLTNGLLWGMGL